MSAAQPSSDGKTPASSPPTGIARLLAAPWVLLFLTGILAVASIFGLKKLRNEDDVLVFLPSTEPEVITFQDVAKRFGAMRVALIGLTPRGDRELFSADLLDRIAKLSDAITNTTGVDRVVSLSTMTDLRAQDGGVDVQPLLPTPLPTSPAELQALKQHSLRLSHVRGTVISADGRSSLIMVFLTEGARTLPLAQSIRALTKQALDDTCLLTFGGAPFAGPAIYEDTQADVRKLTPLALLLFLGVVLLAFRGVLPVILTVATVVLAGVLVLALMGATGEAFTVVTGTLPLVLFASGSQYAIHILGRYYLVRAAAPDAQGSYESRLAAARSALSIAGPPVAVAAANCALGFLSFSVMNIPAMRAFGYACALGVVLCVLFSISVLPAVVARFERRTPRAEPEGFARLGSLMQKSFDWARHHRAALIGLSILTATLCGVGLTRVKVRMEPRAFFRPGSEPALAQAFLDSAFGGGQFVQVLVEGDLVDPRALAEVRRLTTYARSLPGVTQVQSVVDPMSLVAEGMVGIRGLPPRRSQVEQLLFFLGGERSLRTVYSEDRRAALIHVRLLGDAAPVVANLEAYLRDRWPVRLHRPSHTELLQELLYILPADQREPRRQAVLSVLPQLDALREDLNRPPPPGPEGSDPPLVDDTKWLEAQAKATRMLTAALSGSADEQALSNRQSDIVLIAAELLSPLDDPPPSADAARLTAQLTGEPLLDRAFSRAVERNQWLSLGVALVAVLAVLLVAQRAIWPAVLCVLPALMALLVVFGTLGWSGQPIDLGTSLVGSIVTSSGADFAMHYVWYLLRRPARQVVPTVGPVILITAVLLGLGLGVLLLGSAPPLRLFGGLACAGLLLSALFTFLLVPALLPLKNQDTLGV